MSFRPLVAIVHYHLNSGGVTRVISQAVRSLEKSDVDCLILAGSPCNFQIPKNAKSATIEDLGYADGIHCSPINLEEQLNKTAITTFGREPDIWHFHNHSIGKNVPLSLAVRNLADKGRKILLQIHDFPEDRRPLNYSTLLKFTESASSEELEQILYPQDSNIHYSVLNNRDFSYLLNSGFSSENLHLLLNPVSLGKVKKTNSINPFKGRNLWLYPSRCIRRKNIGEFILWASLSDPKKNVFASTLKPTNQEDIPPYERWQELCADKNLPVKFEIGLKYKNDLSEWFDSAHAVITTSVGEGFGLAFLEPFLFKRSVVGRDIKDITIDFKKTNIAFKSLYNALRIPVSWIGEETLLYHIESSMKHSYNLYNRNFESSIAQSAYHAAVSDGYADFGRLNEELQEKVITKILSRPELKKQISPNILNPAEYGENLLNDNYSLIQHFFGLDTYKDTLMGIYSKMLNSRITESEHNIKSTLLDQFLKPEDFYLLRS
ncbi:MAG TPA: hypothetical protein DD381_00820 [Lentisphaeria bacterium]|nr:MAG: hypothetical protein A2X47_00200 [Lentisphaerae bacterium GWF2_38_69]HBM14884.1 hypothetical protein [Lentisphaeria bacterium]